MCQRLACCHITAATPVVRDDILLIYADSNSWLIILCSYALAELPYIINKLWRVDALPAGDTHSLLDWLCTVKAEGACPARYSADHPSDNMVVMHSLLTLLRPCRHVAVSFSPWATRRHRRRRLNCSLYVECCVYGWLRVRLPSTLDGAYSFRFRALIFRERHYFRSLTTDFTGPNGTQDVTWRSAKSEYVESASGSLHLLLYQDLLTWSDCTWFSTVFIKTTNSIAFTDVTIFFSDWGEGSN